ncbi:hypothetical protein GCM10027299_55750 [Larkinella ripae]
MEKPTEKSLSETHQKYIIQIHLQESIQYIVWGTDLSDSEQQDKLLVNHQQAILLFSRIDQIKEAIAQSTAILFDENNLIPWANSFPDSEVDTVYDLDYLLSLVNSELKQEQILQSPKLTHDLIRFINLFGDYAYQVQQQDLLKLRRKRQIRLFFDYSYDSYFWTLPPDELQRRQKRYIKAFRFTKFKADMKRMLAVFIARLSQYQSSL